MSDFCIVIMIIYIIPQTGLAAFTKCRVGH